MAKTKKAPSKTGTVPYQFVAKGKTKKNGSKAKHSHKPTIPSTPKKRPATRRNPELSVRRPVELAQAIAALIGGIIATRQLPQLAAGANNTGVLGYVMNGVAALASAATVHKFAPKYSVYTLLGGASYVVVRALNEKVSPLGQYLDGTGLGDAHASSLGEIQDSYFLFPTEYGADGKPMLPDGFISDLNSRLPRQQITAPTVQQMAGVSRTPLMNKTLYN